MLPPALNSRSTATVDTGTDNTCLASMLRHGNMCSFRFHHPSTSKSTSSSSQQINATSAQVQATNEGASIPVAATIPVISAPVLPLGLSSVPKASVISPFVTPVPSAGPRVTFPPSMTQFMNDPANLQAIQGFGQVMAMCQQNGGMPFLPGMFPFALPGAGTMPLQAPMAVTSFQTPMPQPSPFQPQLVSTVAPVNLAGALNAAGPRKLRIHRSLLMVIASRLRAMMASGTSRGPTRRRKEKTSGQRPPETPPSKGWGIGRKARGSQPSRGWGRVLPMSARSPG
ncbi:unnamed protein product [Cuscuta campestris]|uniref:Uncharacterized protein n=1 Tax=Cuscuta campestris TaxID=132261 RepID=A0A484NJ31_9ASTE|nr:unnamed protein product [Cuscuta campestris]